jgi:hypothetical protein
MANKFQDMAMAISKSNSIDSELQLNDLKARRDEIMKAFDFKIDSITTERAEQKRFQDAAKAEESKNKIRTDLIQQMLDGANPEEAQGLLDKTTKGVFTGREQQPEGFNPNPFPLLDTAAQ